MKKLLAVLLTAAMTMAMLTACGSSNTEATDTTTETTEAEADTATDDAAVEETADAADETADAEAAVSEALADGVLTAGTNAEFPPFEYVGDDGEADGFDIALIKAIGGKLGVEVHCQKEEIFDSMHRI